MDDGVLLNVNELVEKYAPNFLQMVEEYDEAAGYIKNGIYGDNGAIVKFGSMFLAPYVNARVHYGPVVREDWLKKYNLEAPVTLESTPMCCAPSRRTAWKCRWRCATSSLRPASITLIS